MQKVCVCVYSKIIRKKKFGNGIVRCHIEHRLLILFGG